MITIFIPLVPQGQMRARHSRPRITRRGKAAGGMTYKAEKQKTREAEIFRCLARYVPEKPITGPVELTVVAWMPVPKSWTKARREDAVAGRILPDVTPDLSNMVKMIEDCLQGVFIRGRKGTRVQVIIDDDKQVCSLIAKKGYATHPHWTVGIREL